MRLTSGIGHRTSRAKKLSAPLSLRMRFRDMCNAPMKHFEKIVLYGVRVGTDIVPTHAARQLVDGRWTSKLGNCEDIEHDTIEMLNGPRYGVPICFLKRSR
jgi:hypothetical protein